MVSVALMPFLSFIRPPVIAGAGKVLNKWGDVSYKAKGQALS
jgi:hypothetical protein